MTKKQECGVEMSIYSDANDRAFRQAERAWLTEPEPHEGEEPFGFCKDCGEPIYEGDYYYEFVDGECIQAQRKVAPETSNTLGKD